MCSPLFSPLACDVRQRESRFSLWKQVYPASTLNTSNFITIAFVFPKVGVVKAVLFPNTGSGRWRRPGTPDIREVEQAVLRGGVEEQEHDPEAGDRHRPAPDQASGKGELEPRDPGDVSLEFGRQDDAAEAPERNEEEADRGAHQARCRCGCGSSRGRGR